MGATSDRDKYFKAYKSIKSVLESTHNITNKHDNIFLINKKTIEKYLGILEKYNIFEAIIDVKQRTKLRDLEKKIKDDFGDYKLEENIEIIDNFDDTNKEKEFIIVDISFLKNMKKDFDKDKYNNISISVNKNDEKKQLIFNDSGNEDNKINIKEIKKGYYIYDPKDDDIDVFIEGKAEEEKIENEEIEGDKNYDPEFDDSLRTPIIEENSGGADPNNDNDTDGGENTEITTNNPIGVNTETKKAPFAKFDDIIKLIYNSYENSNENEDIISNEIKQYITNNKIVNELEEKDNLDIINNIVTSVNYLIKCYSKKKPNTNITNSINSSINVNEYYPNNSWNQENILIDKDSETSSLIKSSNNNQDVFDSNKDINPFNFSYVKMYSCDCDKPNEEIKEDYYKINLNNDCINLDDCFKLKFEGSCEKCKNKCVCNYKFGSAPEILILKFENPKENEKYIKFDKIENNIDLKEHMYIPTQFNIKYKLLKALYVFNDSKDNNLYIDIPENEKIKYIPYIIFYQKTNDV